MTMQHTAAEVPNGSVPPPHPADAARPHTPPFAVQHAAITQMNNNDEHSADEQEHDEDEWHASATDDDEDGDDATFHSPAQRRSEAHVSEDAGSPLLDQYAASPDSVRNHMPETPAEPARVAAEPTRASVEPELTSAPTAAAPVASPTPVSRTLPFLTSPFPAPLPLAPDNNLARAEEMVSVLTSKKRALLLEIGALLTLRERLHTEMASSTEVGAGVPFDYATRFAHSPATLKAMEEATAAWKEEMRQVEQTQEKQSRAASRAQRAAAVQPLSAPAPFITSTSSHTTPSRRTRATVITTASPPRNAQVAPVPAQEMPLSRPHTAPASTAALSMQRPVAVSFASPLSDSSIAEHDEVEEEVSEAPAEESEPLLESEQHDDDDHSIPSSLLHPDDSIEAPAALYNGIGISHEESLYIDAPSDDEIEQPHQLQQWYQPERLQQPAATVMPDYNYTPHSYNTSAPLPPRPHTAQPYSQHQQQQSQQYQQHRSHSTQHQSLPPRQQVPASTAPSQYTRPSTSAARFHHPTGSDRLSLPSDIHSSRSPSTVPSSSLPAASSVHSTPSPSAVPYSSRKKLMLQRYEMDAMESFGGQSLTSVAAEAHERERKARISNGYYSNFNPKERHEAAHAILSPAKSIRHEQQPILVAAAPQPLRNITNTHTTHSTRNGTSATKKQSSGLAAHTTPSKAVPVPVLRWS